MLLGQVRAAYRRRGWGFTDPQQIAQCAKEGFVEKLLAQEGEGCHLWGTLAVNKVRVHSCPEIELAERHTTCALSQLLAATSSFAWLWWLSNGLQMRNNSGSKGCSAAGWSQVAGNFHFAPGKSFQQGAVHVHDLVPFQRCGTPEPLRSVMSAHSAQSRRLSGASK